MNEMDSSELEALVSAQRSTLAREPVNGAAFPMVPKSHTLTKAELAESISDNLGLNKREAKEMVELFFDVVCHALCNGETVKLSGFGNFQLRDKVTRPGRNPKTKEPMPIKARRVVTFRASAKLKDLVCEPKAAKSSMMR